MKLQMRSVFYLLPVVLSFIKKVTSQVLGSNSFLLKYTSKEQKNMKVTSVKRTLYSCISEETLVTHLEITSGS